jgi:DnaJ-class molecular chaperone
MKNNAKKK